jgi:hypothetical protein
MASTKYSSLCGGQTNHWSGGYKPDVEKKLFKFD